MTSAIRRIRPTVFVGWALLATAAGVVLLGHRKDPPEDVSTLSPPHHRLRKTVGKSMRERRPMADDPAARIARCKTAGNVVGMQTAVRDWFAEDPLAVRDWVASQKSLKSLQPVLVQIAKDVCDAGNPADALKWAELLEPGPQRDQTLLEIYATGWRHHSLPEDEIRAAPFPPGQIDFLLSGAADD